jgi:hypothetical protein
MIYNKLKGKESQEEKEINLEEAQYNLGVFCGLIKKVLIENNNDGKMFGTASNFAGDKRSAGSGGYWKVAPDDDEPREDLTKEEIEALEEDELEENASAMGAGAVTGFSAPLGKRDKVKPKKSKGKKKELEEMTNKLTNYLLKIMEKQ